MYQKILVGYDDSPASRAALLEAAHWVKRHGGELTLVHAVFFETEEYSVAPEQLDKRIRLGQRLCAAAVAGLADDPGVTVRSLISEGEPPAVLIDTARSTGADLIVLGTYGRRGLGRMLMGSVTAQVISRARADVLVVKRPSWGWSARAGAADGAPPPAADAPVPRLEAQRSPDHRGEYRSILVPYDGSTFGKSALARACDIARADGSVVAALYAIPRYEEMVGFLRTEGISARLDEEAAKIVAEARQQAAASGVTIATSIAGGAADSRIVESVRKSGFDLVVMGSHGHRGMDRALLGSTAERVIVNAPCPVLVVKEKR